MLTRSALLSCSLMISAWLLVSGVLAGAVAGEVATDEASVLRAYRQHWRHWPPAEIDAEVVFRELCDASSMPPRSPATTATVELGQKLFHEKRLARDGTLACADCHRAELGWGNGTAVAMGIAGQAGQRNVPSVENSARKRRWGWDGRHATLEAQLLAPLSRADEMGNLDVAEVLGRLQALPDYRDRFSTVFGRQTVAQADLAEALRAYLDSLWHRSRFERFCAGEHGQLSTRETRGLHLFRTRAGCANCHLGPLLTDERFHNLGISFFGAPAEDLGRYEVSGRPADAGAFLTPSLRGVARSATYMHHGLFRSLAGVVHFYAGGGGRVHARHAAEAAHPLFVHEARRSIHLRPRALDADEQAALVAFLRAL